MKALSALIYRNIKLFFKDKGLFFAALIAPLIILGLYVLFLGNVFESSFASALPDTVSVPTSIIKGYAAGWEISSILAVCGVTVAFIANLVIVQDKITGAVNDLTIAPVKPSILSLSYYISTEIITLIICGFALAIGLLYLAMVGWYLSLVDVLLIMLDVVILTLFGTALSSIVSRFLKSQGGMSAVSTIVSSVYGFICGAYYPISQFSTGIRNVVSCLPGTYGTSLVRNHFLSGIFNELSTTYNFPPDTINLMKDGFDVNFYFFDTQVSISTMYIVMLASIAVCVTIFILLSSRKKSKKLPLQNAVKVK